MWKPFLTTAGVCLIALLVACSGKTEKTVGAMTLTRADTCAVDGMVLLDYAGPKAQLVWRDGHRTFYCEAREAFTPWLDPIQRRRISAFFVQDFSGLPWGVYTGHWMNAEQAYFVIDSRQMGAMGLSYVSFSSVAAAQAFQRAHGGTVLALKDITPSVLQHSEALMRAQVASSGTGEADE